MGARVLFYVQHLLGVGHVRRAEILCRAMADHGCSVTVALGGVPLPGPSFPGARVVRLPAAKIANGDFSQLLDDRDIPVDGVWQAMRRNALLRLLDTVDPDVLLIEMYPFGRRQFRFELDPLLKSARSRSRRPAIVTSVRDILVTSATRARLEETVGTIRRLIDAVLVHADPAVVRLDATFPVAAQISDLIHYTGYVCDTSGEGRSAGVGEVIVSAGGGAVGAPLLFTAAAARPLTSLAEVTWRFITGPNFPEDDFRRLAELSDPLTIVERFRSDFRDRVAGCALSISQAGYNTVMDILYSRAPSIVVPFESHSETEQRRRADILADRGLLSVVSADRLSPQALTAAAEAALAQVPSAVQAIDFSGAAATARLIGELARMPRAAHLPE
jgi:predicted glycosyltransferase